MDSHAVLACNEASFNEPDERHVSRVALAFGARATLSLQALAVALAALASARA